MSFSDGMCADCSARARAEWALPANARQVIVPQRRSLRPDFALATGLLLVGVGVAFGILIGPPPRTVSLPEPSTSVATDDGREPAARGDGDATVTPGAPYGSNATAAVASPRQVATAVDLGTARDAERRRWPRIARVAARRPVRTAHQPAIERSIDPVSDPARSADPPPRLSSEEISALDRVPLQAP